MITEGQKLKKGIILICADNGPRDGRPNVAYPPLPKKDYSNEMSPGKREKYSNSYNAAFKNNP